MSKQKQDKNSPMVVSVPHRDVSTANQVAICIGAINCLVAALRDVPATDFSKTVKDLPRESEIAVENSLAVALDRMESIFKDAGRWSLDFQSDIERRYFEQGEENMKAIRAARAQYETAQAREKAQVAAAEELTTPHFRYKPSLVKVGDNWVAFIGDPNDKDNSLIGVGRNPAEAIRCFDAQFKGEPSEELKKWLDERAAQVEAGTEENTNDKTSMDGQGSQIPPGPESPGDPS